MNTIFLLEIVDYETGHVYGSIEGTAYFISTQLQTILETLPEEHGLTINKKED